MTRRRAGLAGLAGVLLAVSLLFLGLAEATAQGGSNGAQSDGQIQADVMKSLENKRFKDVKVSVKNGVVTLTGTVDVYSAKLDADNRVGYGTILFNAFTIGVQNGVVTLGGTAYGPSDKDSAVSMVENYPGVKDVVDNIDVAPVSPMDDRIRLAVARSIYGYPQLNKYAIDPAKPIRIMVINGNVTLSGVVDSQADKDVANIRANGVPGVFKVVNNLEVAAEGAEKSEKEKPEK